MAKSKSFSSIASDIWNKLPYHLSSETGTETWAMKKENLRSLERTEQVMVRWMCGVSLKDRKCSVDLYSLLGVQSVADVVRCGRLRWFRHLECKSVDDWVSACRKVKLAEVRCRGGIGRLGDNVWRMIWMCLVYILKGQYLGICGGTS